MEVLSLLLETFFGLNSDYIHSVYDKIFYMIQLGNWRFFEVHAIPVTLRNWFFDKLLEYMQKQNTTNN
jgi:hypothetical protein